MSGPEIRIDQLTGMRTILAAQRADRPEGFAVSRQQPKGPAQCPFCEGSEGRTPPELWARRDEDGEPDTPGWSVRVVPNLFPALAEEGHSASATGTASEADPAAFTAAGDPLAASKRVGEADLFASRPATGAHEVIIHAPEHVTSLAALDEAQFAAAIAAWRERMRAHGDAACVQLIVNEGGGAGASLEHSHAQLYALQFVPPEIARERERVSAYRERTAGGSLLSDILVEEVRRGERLVAIDDDAALLCPWASQSPFELRVLPRRPAARFEHDDAGTEMIRIAMRVLAARFDGPPELNLWVRSAPRGVEHFDWHLDIAPRTTVRAGFELGTGVEINIFPPERAAAELRELVEG